MASYGVEATGIAFSLLPVRVDTRLIVFELVSSIQSEPAPNPSPQEPKPMSERETTLFVFGLIFRRCGDAYSLTQTKPPPAAAAQGATFGETLIRATTVGVPAAPAATDASRQAPSRVRAKVRMGATIVRKRSKNSGFVLIVR